MGRVARRSLLALPVALLSASIAHAQPAARDRPPIAPDSILAPGPTGDGFLAWRSAIAARGRTGASYLVDGERYQLLVLTPMAVDALAQDSLIVKATRGCQRALALSEAQVASTDTIDPWAAFDAAARARPLVAIAIYPKEQRRFDCHAGVLARFAALSRGALYGAFGPARVFEQVASAEVRRDGLVEATPLTGRAPVTKVTRAQLVVDGSEQVRLWIDPLAFSPDAEGRVPRLEVHVYNPVDPEPDVLPLPDRLIRAVWQQMLPWQARSLDADGAALVPPPVEFAAPTDSSLRLAHEAFSRGALGVSASEALTRLMFQPRPPQREIRDAMLASAVAFSLRGRDPEALSLIADVVEVYPCLTLAPEAPASLRDMADASRKPARCTSIPLPVIALRSVVPGYGQATGPLRRRLALTVFASTALTYAAAEGVRGFARTAYREYEEYRGTDFPNAVTRYKRAQNARTAGNALTVAAAGLWIGAGVEAVWNEWQHKRRLDDVRAVGARRARGVGVSPALAPGHLGLQVTF